MTRSSYLSIGIVLAILGAAALIYQNVSYTQRETVAEVGALNITADTRKNVSLPPILGGLALAAGAGCIVMGLRKP